LIDLHFDALSLDELFEIGLGFCAIGLAREFVALRGLWRIYAKHSDAQLGLVGGDNSEGVAVGHALNDAFLGALGVLACRGGSS
jgi:hypothetical protein